MNKLLNTMFKNRGYTPDFLENINKCEHLLPTNIDTMCERLNHYEKTGETVVLLTDFDMDGIMSGVIGLAGMAELGFHVALYLPPTDSYGFDESDIDSILSDYPDAKCIVTADVGISAYDGVKYAESKGIEVLITDHHQPVDVSIPGKSVHVDPVLDYGDDYFGGICGAHVLYLVLKYYTEHYDKDYHIQSRINRLRAFAGIATIADNMPLYYENRQLVKDAVNICRFVYSDGIRDNADCIDGVPVYRRAFQGLFTMFDMFAQEGKIRNGDSIDEMFFGFYAAPAFNSIKRMNDDISYAYNVFFESREKSEESMRYILNLTQERKDLEAKFFDEILTSKQQYAPHIYISDVPSGVKGLLAQKLMAFSGEPTLVITERPDGSFEGSGRSPSWFKFRQQTIGLDYANVAGHETAFGISIESKRALDDLYAYLKFAIDKVRPSDDDLSFKPDFIISTIDSEHDTDVNVELFEDFVTECELYKPFGHGFEEPCIRLDFEPKKAYWSHFGKDEHLNAHVKAILPGGLVVLFFNSAEYFPNGIGYGTLPETLSVLGKLNINDFAGTRTIQFLGRLNHEVTANGGDE